jgi:hypothetical protein
MGERDCKSLQHLLPKCIGKEIGLSKEQIDKFTTRIPRKIHQAEDYYVPTVLQEVKRAKRVEGIIFTAEDILKMRREGFFRK